MDRAYNKSKRKKFKFRTKSEKQKRTISEEQMYILTRKKLPKNLADNCTFRTVLFYKSNNYKLLQAGPFYQKNDAKINAIS